jgi:hypothetical protein
MEQSRKDNHWYLLTGLILGLAIGLIISLMIVPVINADALPHELSEEAKADYREKIALAYAANHDLERAISRLELLHDAQPVQTLISQAQNMLARGESEAISRAVADLATQLDALLFPGNQSP